MHVYSQDLTHRACTTTPQIATNTQPLPPPTPYRPPASRAPGRGQRARGAVRRPDGRDRARQLRDTLLPGGPWGEGPAEPEDDKRGAGQVRAEGAL